MDIYSLFDGGNTKPLTHNKNMIRQYLHQTDRIHQFQIKPNIDNKDFPSIKTTQEFEKYIQTQNVFGNVFVNLDFKENEWYQCELVEGNSAWIAKDEAGVYRYFSRIQRGGTISLNIFDVIEIVLGGGDNDAGNAFRNARNRLANLFGLELKDEWVLQQAQKYQDNLAYVRGERKELEQAYPDLFLYIQKYRPILEYFNDHHEDGLFRVFSYQGQHVFFSAANRIKEKLKISQSTVTRSINMLTLIGLIAKIPHSQLPSQLLEISDKIMDYRIAKGYVGGKRITFYAVPQYSKETLEAANQIVTILQAAGIWGSLITKEKVIKIFGEAKAKEVFLAEYTIKKVNPVKSSDSSEDEVEDAMEPPFDIGDDDIPF